jgi:hypothetical protein
LLGFFQNFLVFGFWEPSNLIGQLASLDHPIYTPASRGSNNALIILITSLMWFKALLATR